MTIWFLLVAYEFSLETDRSDLEKAPVEGWGEGGGGEGLMIKVKWVKWKRKKSSDSRKLAATFVYTRVDFSTVFLLWRARGEFTYEGPTWSLFFFSFFLLWAGWVPSSCMYTLGRWTPSGFDVRQKHCHRKRDVRLSVVQPSDCHFPACIRFRTRNVFFPRLFPSRNETVFLLLPRAFSHTFNYFFPDQGSLRLSSYCRHTCAYSFSQQIHAEISPRHLQGIFVKQPRWSNLLLPQF